MIYPSGHVGQQSISSLLHEEAHARVVWRQVELAGAIRTEVDAFLHIVLKQDFATTLVSHFVLQLDSLPVLGNHVESEADSVAFAVVRCHRFVLLQVFVPDLSQTEPAVARVSIQVEVLDEIIQFLLKRIDDDFLWLFNRFFVLNFSSAAIFADKGKCR